MDLSILIKTADFYAVYQKYVEDRGPVIALEPGPPILV
jgi:hypothetical protein